QAAQREIADLTEQLDSIQDPDVDLRQQLNDAQAKIDELTGQVGQLTTDLGNERAGRAADAEAAQQSQAAAVAEVQGQLNAVQSDLDAIRNLFPMDEDSFRAAAPLGDYTVTVERAQCTIINCLELSSLSLSFPDSTQVSGNRANGVLAFADGSYAARGQLSSEQAPLCNGVETEATFLLVFHATTATASNGLLAATAMEGTYRETIDNGDCVGQFREYKVAMTK
ncbi:MAG TPA: hypothetical protein PLV68_13055, partial [Ilumatobacteraceae bacterium]|nr:hypothetical protein [Ilumatobacteraceae bacterium]